MDNIDVSGVVKRAKENASMKNIYIKLLSIFVALILIASILNIKVSTKQGIDYNVHAIEMPLYLKIMDFVDRHYNYKNIVANILGSTKNDNAKVVSIFNWVISNMHKTFGELPVIDDHPLNILIRGYGTQDQFEDIFTLLCNYAGQEAFFKLFKNSSGGVYFISFVKIDGKWCPLSAFGGVYAIKNGVIASVDDILADQNNLSPFSSGLPGFEADTFLEEIRSMDFKSWSVRTRGQSPGGRIMCFVSRMLSHIR